MNSKSRRGADCFNTALAFLVHRDVHVRTAIRTRHVSKLVEAVKAAISEGEPLIIVGGGDGTINAVAGLFVGSQSRLGVLAMGTGNAFARDLGIPTDVAKACEIALDGDKASVDLGRIAGGHFVNVATVGLSTRIAQNLTDPMKRRFGRFVYLAALLRAYRDVQPFHAILETENGREEFDSIQIVIGNGRFHAGPFPVLPDASIREGKVSIYAIEARTKSEFIKFAFFLPGGHHVQLKEVHSQHCKGGKLTTVPPMPVTVDGQVDMMTPVEFTTIPCGLNVMCAPNFLN